MANILLIIDYSNFIHAKKIIDHFKQDKVDICTLKNTKVKENLLKYDKLLIDSSLSNLQKQDIIEKCSFVASIRTFKKDFDIRLINEISKNSGTIEKEQGIQKGKDILCHSDINVEKVARIAYELSDDSLINFDHSGDLYSSNLWRKIVNDINEDYPNVYRKDASIADIAYYMSLNNKTNYLVEAIDESLAIKTLIFNGYTLKSHYLCGETNLLGHIIYFNNIDYVLENL